eukprot:UN15042
MDMFLDRCSQLYEIVLFTASISDYADPLLDRLDRRKTLEHRLYRIHRIRKGRCFVKDLSYLGRNIEDKNAIPIPSWFDDDR